jgi:hypothetical protein
MDYLVFKSIYSLFKFYYNYKGKLSKKGIESGADLYMTKPFDPDFIVSKTAQILGVAF